MILPVIKGLSRLAKDTAGAQLAHIADTVTALADQMAEARETQGAMLAVLNRLVEITEAQSEMLAEVLGAAKAEPGPSPVAIQLEALTAAVNVNTELMRSMSEQLDELPEAIGGVIGGTAPTRPVGSS